MNCPKCNAYVPNSAHKCVACGELIDQITQKDYNDAVLIYHGERIPVYVTKIERMFGPTGGKPIDKFTVVEI